MLKLYGSAHSRALRVIWLAGELGLKYEHKEFLPRSPETRTTDYLALNANARVPTLDDDGFILSESMAINMYLAKKHKSPLYPADPKLEALCWQWSLWETDRLDRQIVDYVRNIVAEKPEDRDAAVAAAAWKQVQPAFDVLEGALAKSPWLAGPAFSISDLNVASALYRALSIDVSRWPKLDAWLRTCWDRPAAKKARAMREH
ncbi:MAG: glutathione S-transferase family protein [Betaproteobacteria bacterium]